MQAQSVGLDKEEADDAVLHNRTETLVHCAAEGVLKVEREARGSRQLRTRVCTAGGGGGRGVRGRSGVSREEGKA